VPLPLCLIIFALNVVENVRMFSVQLENYVSAEGIKFVLFGLVAVVAERSEIISLQDIVVGLVNSVIDSPVSHYGICCHLAWL